MRPKNFNIHDVIDALCGTCSTIDEHLPDEMEWTELTNDDHNAIDNEIFLCDTCGWWCELSERSDAGADGEVCEDCAE